MSHFVPPFSPPDSDPTPRSGSPIDDDSSFESVSGGISLIVSGFDRSNNPNAGIHQFRSIYPDIIAVSTQKAPHRYLLPFTFLSLTPGDNLRPVDFIFVSLDNKEFSAPRPDLLNWLKAAIQDHGKFVARWITGKGPDKTRRGFFRMENMTIAQRMKSRFETVLTQKGFHFQNCTTATHAHAGIRIVVDFLDSASLDALTETPLIVDRISYPVSRPRFVEPDFGYDVAITGCGGIQGFEGCMNAHIRRHMGPVIARSRMALGGDVYVVIFKTWELTSQFLSSPLPHPRSVPTHIQLSDPILLYFFNNRGCPASPQYLAPNPPTSSDSPSLQKQIDILRDQGVQCFSTMNAMLATQSNLITDVRQSNLELRNALAASCNTNAAGQLVSMAHSDLLYLRSELNSLRGSLASATDPNLRASLTQQIEETMSSIEAQRNIRDEADAHYRSLMRATQSLIAGPVSDSPASARPAEVSNTRRQCRRLDEPSPDDEQEVQSSLMPVDGPPASTGNMDS
ncbi:uncharacterized protein EV420DRAFT_1751343 [Desarmillaria tabescens]|uniref:Uncharacterized protein n=1 Tax=Armillaria tabescens TaxID=1929756 RepID=A0AA39MUE1_ARMTA|nr:uncharacterized protein EV420DRAFT_1751343 [Desarmillaria tabescens]KAK0446583.1 hypothetical protein EV420DRAFT_1751343 [Desarmillaria tabescens]